MRMISLILVGLLVGYQSSVAQEPDSTWIVPQSPSQSFNLSDFLDLQEEGYQFWGNEFSGHWGGFYMGLNFFLKEDYSSYAADKEGFMDLRIWRSFSYQINVLQKSIGLQRYRNTIGLVTGIGMVFDDYRLAPSVTIEPDENGVIQPVYPTYEEMKKSKVSTSFIRVPLLIEVQIPTHHYQHRLWISAGAIAGYRIGGHSKVKYHHYGKSDKLKSKENLGLNDFRYSFTARLGYGRIKLIAEYSPVTFFKSEIGPELYPFTVGLGIVTW